MDETTNGKGAVDLNPARINAALSPVLHTVLDSMRVHLGGVSIAALAGTVGAVFLPNLDDLRKVDVESMPEGVAEFYRGVIAIVEHVNELHREAENPTILRP
jgi:hypothetical protein